MNIGLKGPIKQDKRGNGGKQGSSKPKRAQQKTKGGPANMHTATH